MPDSPCVYFHRDDHAGLGRRLIALLVDFVVVMSLLNLPLLVVGRSRPDLAPSGRKSAAAASMRVALAAVVLYHLGLRRLRGGTLGYRVAGIRLTDLSARPPGWKTLLVRTVMAVPGVLLLGAAYWSVPFEARRRALHDKFSGTWMVRAGARPAGDAQQTYKAIFLGNVVLPYWDVDPIDAPGPATP